MEKELRALGMTRIAGVDEAGRGPLAGPVVAAAVIMPEHPLIAGIDDSKKLSPDVRSRLYDEILQNAVSVGVGIVGHETIDQVNILNATFLAMNRAVAGLAVRPDHILVDGNRYREIEGVRIPFTTVVGGDARCYSVAAASIVAKVRRDAIMAEMDCLYPEYGFARHKGYPTAAHRAAIARLGLTPIHRRSFSCGEAHG